MLLHTIDCSGLDCCSCYDSIVDRVAALYLSRYILISDVISDSDLFQDLKELIYCRLWNEVLQNDLFEWFV